MNGGGAFFGRDVVTAETPVTRSAALAFAAAVGDTCSERSGELLAPPMFAVVPALPCLLAAKRRATELHTLHGEHDLRFLGALRVGTTIATSAGLLGIHPTSAGSTIVTRATLREGSGAAVGVQHMVSLLRGRTLDRQGGAKAPAHPASSAFAGRPPAREVTIPLDEDLGRRYGRASGDDSPYTYDADTARALGYAKPILHGMCTLAMAGRQVTDFLCPGEPWRLQRLAARFSGLLYLTPGQAITVRLWHGGEDTGAGGAVFEVYDRDGARVLSNGWAEAAQ